MSTSEVKNEDPKTMDVKAENLSETIKTNPRDFVKDDPIVYIEPNKVTTGKVTNVIDENGVIKLDITPYSNDAKPIRVKANDPKLDALFFNAKNDKKVHTRFSYSELKELLKKDNSGKNKIFGLTWKDLDNSGKAYNSLMLGNRTEVIQNLQMSREKEVDGKTIDEKFSVDGRLELRRASSGKAYVHAEFKQQQLNLDAPLYGRDFTNEEKKQLQKTGELGLVKDFTNHQTGEMYNLWVSVDVKLNKVVTKREKGIRIENMFGTKTTKAQKEGFLKGQGQVINFKKTDGTKMSLFIQPSAASTKNDGLRTFQVEKAKELGLIPEKKNSNSNGQKLK